MPIISAFFPHEQVLTFNKWPTEYLELLKAEALAINSGLIIAATLQLGHNIVQKVMKADSRFTELTILPFSL